VPEALKPFAINLRALRKARGWTQDRLGDLAGGMTQGYVSRLENGRVDPSWRTIDRLAKVLEVDPGDLVRGRAEPEGPDASASP
jgi:transcriptional regulator with XRE-family HTH domain